MTRGAACPGPSCSGRRILFPSCLPNAVGRRARRTRSEPRTCRAHTGCDGSCTRETAAADAFSSKFQPLHDPSELRPRIVRLTLFFRFTSVLRVFVSSPLCLLLTRIILCLCPFSALSINASDYLNLSLSEVRRTPKVSRRYAVRTRTRTPGAGRLHYFIYPRQCAMLMP
jgi:hypothetical protein